jgi:hypothetical protein
LLGLRNLLQDFLYDVNILVARIAVLQPH